MANPGGAESLGAVKVDVGADIAPLIAELDKAKQQAQQKGVEAGQAAAQGFTQGVGSGGGSFGGGIAGPGIGMGGAGGAAPPNVVAAAGAGGTGGFAAVFNGVVATLGDLIQAIKRFEQIGETVGNGIVENTKRQAELTRAIENFQFAAAHARDVNQDRFARATGANLNVDPFQAAQWAKMDEQATAAESALQKHEGNLSLGDYYSLGMEKAIKTFSPFGWVASAFGKRIYTSSITQERENARAVRAEANARQAQLFAVAQRNLEQTGQGEIVYEEALAAGLEPRESMRHAGMALTPVQAAGFRASIRGDTNWLRELMHRFGDSFNEKQERAIQMLGIDRTVRR